MNRIVVTALAASIVFALSATPAHAQSLTNGIYVVTVKGIAVDGTNPGANFMVNMPAVLVVYESFTPERPAEMCLFISDPPFWRPTSFAPTGASWLASWLGCGSSTPGGRAFTSSTDALVGKVFRFQTDDYDVVAVTAPLGEQRTESAAVGVNAFLTDTSEFQGPECFLIRCDPLKKLWNLVGDGHWYAMTFDKGETVSGVIELTDRVPGTPSLYTRGYSARFEGKLYGRLQ